MYVDEIIALTRLSHGGPAEVADLAGAVLDLVEQLRDASLRAEVAETALEVELARLAALRHAISRFRGADPASLAALLRELKRVADA